MDFQIFFPVIYVVLFAILFGICLDLANLNSYVICIGISLSYDARVSLWMQDEKYFEDEVNY